MKTEPLTPQQRRELYESAKDIVMVDFDGTLCSWSYPDMGDPEPGARHFMRSLIRRNLRPIVWSCRLSPEFNTPEEIGIAYDQMNQWLNKHDIPFHEIDLGENGKRLCLAYVDDRNAQYTGNWDRVLGRVDSLIEKERARRKGSAA